MNASRLAIAVCVLVLCSCDREPSSLTVSISTEEPAPVMAATMRDVLASVDLDLLVEPTSDPYTILDAVRDSEADFGIVDEPPRRVAGIATVVPLYPSILHVLYRKDRLVTGFPDLIEGQQIYAGPIGGTAWRILQQLADDYLVPTGAFNVLSDPWQVEPDVYFIIGGLLAAESLAQMSDYQMYSFGEVTRFGFGTPAEGLALKYPNIRPFILPESIYGSFNDQPVITITTRTVLVARDDLDPNLVYLVARELFEQAHRFSVEYPLVLNELHEDLDAKTLALPLHPGSRFYIDKDEPGFFERYAETIGVSLTLLVLIGSGLVTLLRMRKSRKKDRIDVYYQQVLEIRHALSATLNMGQYKALEDKLKAIQEEVFGLLIAERLNVDESLTLFLDLSNRVLGEISARQFQKTNL